MLGINLDNSSMFVMDNNFRVEIPEWADKQNPVMLWQVAPQQAGGRTNLLTGRGRVSIVNKFAILIGNTLVKHGILYEDEDGMPYGNQELVFEHWVWPTVNCACILITEELRPS
ncbi:hypothetical protein JCM1840_003196, partial [Sporobolomyces johnsonii]